MKLLEYKTSPLTKWRVVKAILVLMFILLFGTFGYMLIERWAFLDSLYMTVITITTVGYREVAAVSLEGRVFTIFLIFSGVGIIAYILGIVAQTMIDFQVRAIIGRRKLGRILKTIKNHYIICGFGRIGRIISRELNANKIPLVIIDSAKEINQDLEEEGIPFIIDDATSEDVLIEAGVERAKGLISVVASDADNLFITMTARGLNHDLFISARADKEHTEKKLLRGGANRVVMPYLIGGQKMAQTIIKPAVSDFIEFAINDNEIGLEINELKVGADSRLKGLTLVESGIRQELDVIIVAVRKTDGEMSFNPSSQTRIEDGDILIALGRTRDLSKLAEILS
jgi:voltage-gated potassium channel